MKPHILLTGWLLIGTLVACAPPPNDEVQLRSQLDTLLQSARERKLEPLLAIMAEDFSGKSGAEPFNRQAARQFLAFHFLRNPSVYVLASNITLDILPPTARIGLDIAVAGGRSVVPEQGQIYHLDTEWQKRDTGWLLTRAQWQSRL